MAASNRRDLPPAQAAVDAIQADPESHLVKLVALQDEFPRALTVLGLCKVENDGDVRVAVRPIAAEDDSDHVADLDLEMDLDLDHQLAIAHEPVNNEA